MVKERQIFLRRLMLSFDLFIVCVTFFSGFLLKNNFEDFFESPVKYLVLVPVLLVIWGGLLYYFGLYESFRTKQITDVLLIMAKAGLIGWAFFSGFIYAAKFHSISSLHIFYSFLFAMLLISIEKIILLRYFRYQRKKGISTRNILIVGTGKRAQRFISSINRNIEWGIKIIGLIDNEVKKESVICGHTVIGALNDVSWLIRTYVVDEVVFVVPRSWLGMIEETMYICETEGIQVSVAVDLFELRISKAKQTHLDGFPMLRFENTPDKLLSLFIKRLFDLTVSGTALVLLSPVLVITAVVVKTTSKGCIFFRQSRSSLHGRRFTLYKFRTMVEDAEARLNDLLAYNEMQGPVFKIKNDPRITKVGKFLRKFSIDEFPQLWNVFKGDMSLVGPRPPIPSEVEKYEPWQRRRLSMPPGITCLWQVNGRNKIVDFNDWMRLDLEYIDNWSLWLDFKILLKTIPTVLFGIGAK
jgi:exopolysaccharide biosynthesis polyprenyl glycosylphosphotransferase